MTDFSDHVQQAVGEAYRIERELGGGGMSRVFLAEEVRLGRTVVIKVLPPEMAAGVNVERFEREIQLAARLQHPHIVPLLTAGAGGDLLYYVMPFIEGESLRSRLARAGELPIDDAVRVLEDVLDALAYAHGQGIVHRDIKPDNVLLTGRHAVVSDFGVAKAVTSSTGESTLTSLGVALGTPAYMSPEQAVGDPHVDHRADIYAFGAMAYEILTGQPPFTGANAQRVLSAHVMQTPEPVTRYRDTVPPVLADLVMECLAKKPADRPQHATDLIPRLAALHTPSGGSTPTAAPTLAGMDRAVPLSRTQPGRVVLVFVLAAALLLAVARGLMFALGLPDWVYPAAIGLAALGLPIVLLTGHHERRRARAREPAGPAPMSTGMTRFFTWKRTFTAWLVAVAGLVVLAGGAMAMRALGIGPFATLLSSGALHDRQTILLSDFVNHAADSTLGSTLTGAFRVDLSQSPAVQLLDPQAIANTLARMRRPADTRLTPDVAREVAQRAGVTAMVGGRIDPAGGGYVLSANVVEVGTGRVLTAVRAAAADDDHVIAAIDRLSRDLRERIGESLVTIRRTQPLEQVTTTSLDALREYTAGNRRFDVGDYDGAAELLRQAIAQDSTFAMAYRKLAVVLSNTGGSDAEMVAASTHAFQLRDRLPPLERDLATAWYYQWVDYDPERTTVAYRSVLDRDSTDPTALINLSVILANQGDYDGCLQLARRAIALGGNGLPYINAAAAAAYQGHWNLADSLINQGAARSPSDPTLRWFRTAFTASRGDYAAAERMARAEIEAAGASPWAVGSSQILLAALAELHGQLEAAIQHTRVAATAFGPGRALALLGYFEVGPRLLFLDDSTGARRLLAQAIKQYPLSSMAPLDRPYPVLAVGYARAGRLDEARRLLAEYQRNIPAGIRNRDTGVPEIEGAIAFAEGRWPDAIAAYRQLYRGHGCPACGHFEIAQAFDRLGQPDSALAHYLAATTTPEPDRIIVAAYAMAPAYRRMGEIYEARGDRANALAYYQKFVDLWRDADAELQPQVRDVQARVARLAAEPHQPGSRSPLNPDQAPESGNVPTSHGTAPQ